MVRLSCFCIFACCALLAQQWTQILVVSRIGSSDIKDKSQLMESRKAVERQMERFKVNYNMIRQPLMICFYASMFPTLWILCLQVCEKEMKVKAFSKEGLQAPQKDNPQERAKTEMRDKVNQHVEQLETQVAISLCYMHVFSLSCVVRGCLSCYHNMMQNLQRQRLSLSPCTVCKA